MKITIVTFGSRGDVQPCIALGVALKQQGWQVTIVTNTYAESFVRQYGLGYAATPGDATRLVQDIHEAGINMFRFAQAWGKFFQPNMDTIMDTILEASRDADILMHTHFASGARLTADITGARCVRFSLQPIYPTRQIASVMFPPLPLGGVYNLLTHHIADLSGHWAVFESLNRWRAKHALPPLDRLRHPYYQQNGKPTTHLQAYSAHFIPRASDWGSHVHITGFWHLDQASSWQAPPALLNFLEAGEPPVYIGFGSMNDGEFHNLAQIASQSLEMTGQRGVLLGGWGGLGQNANLGRHIFPIAEAPHDWLFPRMKAAVHHGGVGTLAASLRAGLPAVVIPFLGDQPFLGRQVQKLGLGPAPILRKKLTAENLAQALEQALRPEICQNARQMGEKLRQENGSQNAVEIIRSLP